jgi:poly(3-hydroxybutyrate) depolymerase
MKSSILLLTLFLGIALSVSIKTGDDVTVGGLSSGAFMAVQMHVSSSETIRGAAVFAGGPYYCAEGQMVKALTSCMSTGTGINVSGIETTISSYAKSGKIDDTKNLDGSKVFIFAGTSDYTVNPKVDKVAEQIYGDYNVDVKHVYDFAAGHTMPTKNNGVTCTLTQSPFIGKCNYNGALESLNHLFDGTLTEGSGKYDKSNLFSTSQTTSGTVMGSKAYIYAPKACQAEGAECPLHVVFHGCKQTTKDISMQYVETTGYLEVAEDNNLVILFPQATSDMLKNPNGCWDWFGYTDGNYANKSGKQIAEVNRLIKGLKSGSLPVSNAYESTVKGFFKDI